MKDIVGAIMTKITGSALSSAVGNRIYADEAPEGGVDLPYVVYKMADDYPEYNYSDEWENVSIDFINYAALDNNASALTVQGHITTLFDECALTVTGYNHLWMRRVSGGSMGAIDQTAETGVAGVRGYYTSYEILEAKSS